MEEGGVVVVVVGGGAGDRGKTEREPRDEGEEEKCVFFSCSSPVFPCMLGVKVLSFCPSCLIPANDERLDLCSYRVDRSFKGN